MQRPLENTYSSSCIHFWNSAIQVLVVLLSPWLARDDNTLLRRYLEETRNGSDVNDVYTGCYSIARTLDLFVGLCVTSVPYCPYGGFSNLGRVYTGKNYWGQYLNAIQLQRKGSLASLIKTYFLRLSPSFSHPTYSSSGLTLALMYF